jgi:hypothetical protein
MRLDDFCESLARLPFPRVDEPAHPDRDTVQAARFLVGTAVADDELLIDCVAHELRLIESGRLRTGLVPFFVLPCLGIRLAFGYWPPGATPGPHEHTAWTVSAVCRNELEVLTYDRDETYRRRELVPKNRFPAPAGKVGLVYEPCIHEARNPSSHWSFSLHVTSPRDGESPDERPDPVPGLGAPSRAGSPAVEPPVDHPYVHVMTARQRQVHVRQLVRVLATIDPSHTLRAPRLLAKCFALASSATRRMIDPLAPQPGRKRALAGPWLLARTHPELVLELRRHGDAVALDVQTPSDRHEALVFDGVPREAITMAAREPVFDVHTLPGLAPDARSTVGEALEGSGLFRRLWQ